MIMEHIKIPIDIRRALVTEFVGCMRLTGENEAQAIGRVLELFSFLGGVWSRQGLKGLTDTVCVICPNPKYHQAIIQSITDPHVFQTHVYL